MVSTQNVNNMNNINNMKLEIEPVFVDGRFKIRLNFNNIPLNIDNNELNNIVNTNVQQIQDLFVIKPSEATTGKNNNKLGSYYSKNKDKFKLYYQQNKDKMREYHKNYIKSETFKEKQSAYNKRYNEKQKLKKLVHNNENNNVVCINSDSPAEQIE